MVLTDEININFFKYMNLLMEEVYKVFFQDKLPRVLPLMKETLHFSPYRRIWDWFLLEEHTIIKEYGFTHEPYIIPTFLMRRLFTLELIRHKLIVENEHFINFRKSLEIKFPWVVGPFIIKNKVALPVVEILLKGMDFRIAFEVDYDPLHVISTRIQMKKTNLLSTMKLKD